MTELFNTLKTFATNNSNPPTTIKTPGATTLLQQQQQIQIQNSTAHHHSPPPPPPPKTNNNHSPKMLLQSHQSSSSTSTDICCIEESGFNQWHDAMRMVARLPGGLPNEFRIRLWENLADRYLKSHHIEWSRILIKCRANNNNTRKTGRELEIADQIEKDLHRTGSPAFTQSQQKQTILKQVLINYSKWNPTIGYCQGFNMIGALLLEMCEWNEKITLKIFIYLVEGVMPEGYFGQGLRGLAVEMSVFRDILSSRKPTLHKHLTRLQKNENSPPLPDVFTMHWFLTLFIQCLPNVNVLRIWDLILLEGSEILLRTSLVIWAAIENRILSVTNTDEFYSVMGVVTREMLEYGLMDVNSLVKCIVSIAPFPFPSLNELRLKHHSIISKDTNPNRSFYLAKKELDNLKRHYNAMRHRQRTNQSTIIFKNANHSNKQQQNKLFSTITTMNKRQQLNATTTTTKIIKRQTSSGGSGSGKIQQTQQNKTTKNGVQIQTNQINPPSSNNHHSLTRQKQITLAWDKLQRNSSTTSTTKKFRRRKRRSSASSNQSHSTVSNSSSSSSSSSSSTELCDSSSTTSDEHENEIDDDFKVKKLKNQQQIENPAVNQSPSPPCKQDQDDEIMKPENDDSIEIKKCDNDEELIQHVEDGIGGNSIKTQKIINDVDENKVVELDPCREMNEEISPPPIQTKNSDSEIIEIVDNDIPHYLLDTNDSNEFLSQIYKLDKPNSFYENLSQRICQLQFQNLQLIQNCQTTIDRDYLFVNENNSPLPSPISPITSPIPYLHYFTKSNEFEVEDELQPKNNNSTSPPIATIGSTQLTNNLQNHPIIDSSTTFSRELEFSKQDEPTTNIQLDNSKNEENIIIIGADGDKSKRRSIENEIDDDNLNGCGDDGNGDHNPKNEIVLLTNKQNDEIDSDDNNCHDDDDDINLVIRQNIAILQRLKMKTIHYNHDGGDGIATTTDINSSDSSELDDDDCVFPKTKSSQIKSSSSNSITTKKKNSTKLTNIRRRTRSRSNSNSSSNQCSKLCNSTANNTNPNMIVKKSFNPFPTLRRPRVKSKSFALYNKTN